MKLAEALNERAYLKKIIDDLKGRAITNVKYQDGDSGPAEDPSKLLDEIYQSNNKLHDLIIKINHTNSNTLIDNPLSIGTKISLIDLIAERDSTMRMINTVTAMRDATTQRDRYSRNEIRYVVSIDVKEFNEIINTLSKKYRTIDTSLQAANWSVDLIDK